MPCGNKKKRGQEGRPTPTRIDINTCTTNENSLYTDLFSTHTHTRARTYTFTPSIGVTIRMNRMLHISAHYTTNAHNENQVEELCRLPSSTCTVGKFAITSATFMPIQGPLCSTGRSWLQTARGCKFNPLALPHTWHLGSVVRTKPAHQAQRS